MVTMPFTSIADPKAVTTTKRHTLGHIGVDGGGRFYRYAFSGEAIGAGQIIMQKIGQANNDADLALSVAAAIGDLTVTVTLGATAVTLDQYADGYLYVNDVVGEGHAYRIKGHPAAALSANVVITLYDGEGISEALNTTTTQVGLMENAYKDVEIWDADDIDGSCLGVAVSEVADNRYFWAGVSGDFPTLIQGTVTIGEAVMPSNGTDGAVEAADFAGAVESMILGQATLIANADTEYGMIRWSIL